MIINPILPGFNPDPSICRVGEDYYIATSTFEWYPGVQIHHSRDLVNWDLVTRPLNRASQLDMRGNPDSCGVWAPCLSYADGLFWLVYTDVKRFEGSFKDAHNYIVTAPVGTFPASPIGIFDLAGNVSEWVNDFHEIPGTEAVSDPLGPATGEYHVIRGSSWMHGTVTELRLSFRDYGKGPRQDLGFRLARFAEAQ